jgi:hypothetical protein
MTTPNNTESNVRTNDQDEVFNFKIPRKDLELIFKYLSRADLKGAEVPEMNKVISIFDPKNSVR